MKHIVGPSIDLSVRCDSCGRTESLLCLFLRQDLGAVNFEDEECPGDLGLHTKLDDPAFRAEMLSAADCSL